MRLIDADKLMAEMKEAEAEPAYQHTGEDWYVGMVSAEGLVDEAETVEAIPVNYLNSRINDFRQRESYAGKFAADCLQAIINKYNKEKNT